MDKKEVSDNNKIFVSMFFDYLFGVILCYECYDGVINVDGVDGNVFSKILF